MHLTYAKNLTIVLDKETIYNEIIVKNARCIMDVQIKEMMRPASSGHEDIFSKIWFGNEKRAIIQISHGMSEHVERYDDFAKFLATNGFVVCMNEHAGHGSHAKTLGYFADTDGIKHVLSDMKSLQDVLTKGYSDLPVFLLGHSMGSFLARKYITQYGDELAGCILSGTSGPNSAVGVAKIIASIQKTVKGPKSEGHLLTSMAFGSYLKRIESPVNKDAWISSVDEICKEYNADPYCGFKFTAGGFYDLFSLIDDISKKDWATKVPTNLPVYLFAGEEDPVGTYGKGVLLICNRLKEAGLKDVSIKLYPGGRHEMLNEINRQDVYKDTLDWLNNHIT